MGIIGEGKMKLEDYEITKKIVQCKDCKYFFAKKDNNGFCHRQSVFYVKKKDFCSRGVRKDEI